MLGRSLLAALAVAPFTLLVACASTSSNGTVELDGPGMTDTPTSSAAALTSGAPSSGGGVDPANDPAMTATGPKAPDFTLPLVDGGQVSLSDYLGKSVVLIDFWSTTCDPCMTEMPHLVDLYKKYKDKGFVVLAISVDDPDSLAQVRSVVHDKGMVFPVLLDADTSVVSRFNPKKEMPFSVLVAKNGAIVDKHGSYIAGDEKRLQEAVAKLLP